MDDYTRLNATFKLLEKQVLTKCFIIFARRIHSFMAKRTQNTILLHKRIRNIMIDKKISVETLTTKLGVNRNFLRETNQFTYELMSKISEHLGVTVYELIEDDKFQRLYNDAGELVRIERINLP